MAWLAMVVTPAANGFFTRAWKVIVAGLPGVSVLIVTEKPLALVVTVP